MLDLLIGGFLDCGGNLLPGHPFYGFRQEPDSVLLFTNENSLRAKLAVDCMGLGSPTIYAKGIGE